MNQTLKLIQKIFQVRDCTDQYFNNRTRPCLRHQIGLCSAPCVRIISQEQYLEQVLQIKDFMKGNTSELVQTITKQMNQASNQHEYEKAGILRDRIFAIEETTRPQKLESRKSQRNSDVIGLFGDSDASLIKILKIRNGRMTGFEEYFIQEPVSSAQEIIRSFMQQHYINTFAGTDLPTEIVLKEDFQDLETCPGVFI